MKLPVTMYLVIVVSASIVLYQYHLSTTAASTWLMQGEGFARGRNILGETIGGNYINTTNKCFNAPAYLRPNYAKNLPTLYIITPTYRRPEQIAELTRLANTLMLVPNVVWLVIEDATTPTPQVDKLLQRTCLNYEHLIAPMPVQYKKRKGPKPRGVSNRNRGLEWLRANATGGVFYFADDDNSYDLEIFHEIRFTKKVSMFPVGLITRLGVSTPLVRNGNLVGFYDGWMAGRKFPVDMAGFAVSVEFLKQRPKASMPFKPGFEEDGFLKSLAPFEPKEIELLAANCTKILVWHTQTKKNEPVPPLDKNKYNNTNVILLKDLLV